MHADKHAAAPRVHSLARLLRAEVQQGPGSLWHVDAILVPLLRDLGVGGMGGGFSAVVGDGRLPPYSPSAALLYACGHPGMRRCAPAARLVVPPQRPRAARIKKSVDGLLLEPAGTWEGAALSAAGQRHRTDRPVAAAAPRRGQQPPIQPRPSLTGSSFPRQLHPDRSPRPAASASKRAGGFVVATRSAPPDRRPVGCEPITSDLCDDEAVPLIQGHGGRAPADWTFPPGLRTLRYRGLRHATQGWRTPIPDGDKWGRR